MRDVGTRFSKGSTSFIPNKKMTTLANCPFHFKFDSYHTTLARSKPPAELNFEGPFSTLCD